MNPNTKSIIFPALLFLAAALPMPSPAQNLIPSDAFDLSAVRIQIVNAAFVSKLDSPTAHFVESKPDQYHGLVLTLRIAKDNYEPLTLNCQDIALHYRFGRQSDVARCYGLSTFTTIQAEDRAMSLYSQGWGKSTTAAAATRSETVYVDVFFQNMEPDTSELYLFIAQPTGAHFTAQGWKKN